MDRRMRMMNKLPAGMRDLQFQKYTRYAHNALPATWTVFCLSFSTSTVCPHAHHTNHRSHIIHKSLMTHQSHLSHTHISLTHITLSYDNFLRITQEKEAAARRKKQKTHQNMLKKSTRDIITTRTDSATKRLSL